MIDRTHIGMALPVSTLDVERGRLRFFAKAIGETNPVYFDEAAARAEGHPALPAPPTFLFSADQDSGALAKTLAALGVDLPRVLHGEQSFTYHAPVFAGDTVTVEGRVSDIYDKRGGALEFVELASKATNQHGQLVAELKTVVVVRQ